MTKKVYPIAICPQCNNPFQTTKLRKKYCSVKCARRFENAQRDSRIQVTCKKCGKPFLARSSNTNAAYCSDQCRKTRNPPVEKQCLFCGKLFLTRDQKFCSSQCFGKYKSKQSERELACYHCGKKIILKAFKRKGKHIFCSLECFYKADIREDKKITVTCSGCGKSLKVPPCKLKTNKNFYCSKECRASYIIGPNNPSYTSGNGRKVEYGFNWRSQRRKALERDGFTCQYCGKSPKKSRYLHVHHIVPACKFNGDYRTANQLTNLLTLCVKCHKNAEFGKIVIQPKIL